jgi:hypothetical protein
MEGLVVLLIFTIVSGAFSDIYIRSSKSSMQTAERGRVQADARTMLESIARAARVSNVDYTTYATNGIVLTGEATAALTELDLTDPDANAAYRIRKNSNDAVGPTGCWGDGKSYPCLVVSTDGGTTWTPLSPKNSKITNFGVFIFPITDPYVINQANGTYTSNNAPIITVFFGLQGFALNPAENWTYTVQTTVTPRYYKR